MKRHFLITLLFLLISFSFFLLHPNITFAASCSSQGGHCVVTGECAYQVDPIIADVGTDCFPGVKCCPAYDDANKCENRNGHCTALKCSGANLGSGCTWPLNCCQNIKPGGSPGSMYCADGSPGVQTAIGCFDTTSPETVFKKIFGIITGLGGGIALALMLYGVFIVTTSAGMPDKLNAGKDIITSAIVGLIFILLSLFIARLIGVDILGIPGLTA